MSGWRGAVVPGLLLALVAACTGENGAVPIAATVDTLASYAMTVHPILEARCATLDCHGDPGRPLRLYAETGLRAADALRGQRITMDELAANVRALAGVDPPAATLVLDKALGSIHHVGGVIWPSADDVQAACVRGWLAGTSGDPAVTAACQTADAQVALPPP
jgi:hypothetical protein